MSKPLSEMLPEMERDAVERIARFERDGVFAHESTTWRELRLIRALKRVLAVIYRLQMPEHAVILEAINNESGGE
jgi:hypothetical protein